MIIIKCIYVQEHDACISTNARVFMRANQRVASQRADRALNAPATQTLAYS